MNMEKDPDFKSLHADPNMEWDDTRICHDCLNRIPLEGSECDVLDDVGDVNEAIRKNQCEFYIKRQSTEKKDGK